MRKIQWLAFFILGLCAQTWAQNEGTIKGVLLEEGTESTPIPFANVLIKGTTVGTTTDFDGIYSVKITPGIYTLVLSFVGYETQEVANVEVRAGKTSEVNVRMKPESFTLEAVEAVGSATKESERALHVEMKNASTIVQKIGAQELDKKGVSDVAAGLTKVTGISKESDKLYVRGLGDRYNMAYLNGLPIPSTSPKKKLIDLGFFPTKVVENLGIHKTYLPELYGDFAGASVNIDTKDRPGAGFFNVGVQTGFNTTSINNRFYLLNGGTYDFVGIDDGARRVPALVRLPEYNYVSSEVKGYYPFETSFNPEKRFNAPDLGIAAIGGKGVDFENGHRLDILGMGAFKEGHETSLDGFEASYNAEGVLGAGYARYDKVNRYAYKTNISLLGSVGYRFNNLNKLLLTALLINDTEDEMRELEGVPGENDEGHILVRRGTFRQDNLFTGQLNGTHRSENSKYVLEWGGAYNKALGYIPDRRQLFLTEIADGSFVFGNRAGTDASDIHRFYQELNEEDFSTKAALKIGWEKDEYDEFKHELKVGVNGRYKRRDFESFQLNYDVSNFNGSENVDFYNPDNYLNKTNLLAGQFVVSETPMANNNYKASMYTLATYADVDYALSEKLRLTGGLRLEKFGQTIDYTLNGNSMEGVADKFFVLPGVAAKYSLREAHNLRVALSKTVTLPKFTEVAPFVDYDITEQTFGNPNLKNSDNYNLDMKWEYYPEDGLVAVSLFGKYLRNPIEKMLIASAANLNSFVNSEQAIIGGVEIEFKRNVGNMMKQEDAFWNAFTIGFNSTLMYTKVKANPQEVHANGSNFLPTNSTRALQGASPYLANADLSYQKTFGIHTLSTTLDYNVFGDRIYAVGGNGVGEVYEKSVQTLNVNLKNEIGKHWEIGMAAKNLLNPKIERYQKQENLGKEYLRYSFKKGMNISLGITYKF